jgi:hypothetical protein
LLVSSRQTITPELEVFFIEAFAPKVGELGNSKGSDENALDVLLFGSR